MASKKQKNRGAIIPDPVTGYDLLCVKMKIPDNELYRAAFVGQITSLGKAYFWEMSYEQDDRRASEAALLWRELINQYLKIGECGRSDDCIEIPLHDSRIEWFPNDPYRTPNLVPDGYLFPPWYVVGDISLIGAAPGEIATDLARITSIVGWHLQYPLPRFRLNLTGRGVVQVYLRPVHFGGYAQIQSDGDLITLRYADMNRDGGTPGETNEIVVIERVFADEGEHFLDVSAFPSLSDNTIPLGFGLSVQKIVICGFGTSSDCPDCPACPEPDCEECGNGSDCGCDDCNDCADCDCDDCSDNPVNDCGCE